MSATFTTLVSEPEVVAAYPTPGVYPADVEEKIKKWKWVQLYAVVQAAYARGRKTLPMDIQRASKELFVDFSPLMAGESNPKKITLNYMVEGGECYIGVNGLIRDCRMSTLLVPAGWSKAVLKLIEEGIVVITLHKGKDCRWHVAGNHRDGSHRLLLCDENSWRWKLQPNAIDVSVL